VHKLDARAIGKCTRHASVHHPKMVREFVYEIRQVCWLRRATHSLVRKIVQTHQRDGESLPTVSSPRLQPSNIDPGLGILQPEGGVRPEGLESSWHSVLVFDLAGALELRVEEALECALGADGIHTLPEAEGLALRIALL